MNTPHAETSFDAAATLAGLEQVIDRAVDGYLNDQGRRAGLTPLSWTLRHSDRYVPVARLEGQVIATGDTAKDQRIAEQWAAALDLTESSTDAAYREFSGQIPGLDALTTVWCVLDRDADAAAADPR